MKDPIQREELILQSWRFTNLGALVREVLELLEHSDYKIELHVRPLEWVRLGSELESVRMLGRLTLRVIEKAEYSEIALCHKEPKGMGGARHDDHMDNLALGHHSCNLENGSKRP